AAAAAAAAAARARPKAPAATPERAALISEAMGHWAKGHEIFQSLDPKLRAAVATVADQLAPK
ncbi:MAG: hypothetical protein O2905_08550, partial [Proteobacteria bacterium]|nr:hypothetical protein [Pseudomonadota bacterium]